MLLSRRLLDFAVSLCRKQAKDDYINAGFRSSSRSYSVFAP